MSYWIRGILNHTVFLNYSSVPLSLFSDTLILFLYTRVRVRGQFPRPYKTTGKIVGNTFSNAHNIPDGATVTWTSKFYTVPPVSSDFFAILRNTKCTSW